MFSGFRYSSREVAVSGLAKSFGNARLKHDLIALLCFAPFNRATSLYRFVGKSLHQRLLHSVSRRANSAISDSVNWLLHCNSMMRCKVFISCSLLNMGILYTPNCRLQREGRQK